MSVESASPVVSLVTRNNRIDHKQLIAYCDTQDLQHEEAKRSFKPDFHFRQLEKVLEELPVQPDDDVFRNEYYPLMLDWIQQVIHLTKIQAPYIKETKVAKKDGGGSFSVNMVQNAIARLRNLISSSLEQHKDALQDIDYPDDTTCDSRLRAGLHEALSTPKR